MALGRLLRGDPAWGWRHGVIGLRSSATPAFEMSFSRHSRKGCYAFAGAFRREHKRMIASCRAMPSLPAEGMAAAQEADMPESSA